MPYGTPFRLKEEKKRIGTCDVRNKAKYLGGVGRWEGQRPIKRKLWNLDYSVGAFKLDTALFAKRMN